MTASGKIIRGGTVYLTELMPRHEDGPVLMDGYTFEDCTIAGPGILLPLDDATTFDHVVFDKEQFWMIEPERSYHGAIGVKNCVFRRCNFRGVGIAAQFETLRRVFDL